jgi:hypothetical protein
MIRVQGSFSPPAAASIKTKKPKNQKTKKKTKKNLKKPPHQSPENI